MSGKPKTLAEAIAYLYTALDIADRPASWVAHALQVIEIEAERLAQERDEPTVEAMIAELVCHDVEVTIRTDGCYGSGTVDLISERPRYRDGQLEARDTDYTQGETVAECISSAWHYWMAFIADHGANVPPGQEGEA